MTLAKHVKELAMAANKHGQATTDLQLAVLHGASELWRVQARLTSAKIALDDAVVAYVRAENLNTQRPVPPVPAEPIDVDLALETISLSRATTRRGGPHGEDPAEDGLNSSWLERRFRGEF